MPITTMIRSRHGLGLALAMLMLTVSGCVDKRFIIITEPDGAIAYDWQNMPMSSTPADKSFVYYGKYNFMLVKDGYETKLVTEDVKAPWYEWFLIDFVSENMVPWIIHDVRTFHYVLEPRKSVFPDDILPKATALQARAAGIGPPRQSPPQNPQIPPPIVGAQNPPWSPPGVGPPNPPAMSPFVQPPPSGTTPFAH